jgi:hypothetical protein
MNWEEKKHKPCKIHDISDYNNTDLVSGAMMAVVSGLRFNVE